MRWIRVELKSIHTNGNGTYHDRIEDLVVLGTIWTADICEFPFEVYASVTGQRRVMSGIQQVILCRKRIGRTFGELFETFKGYIKSI